VGPARLVEGLIPFLGLRPRCFQLGIQARDLSENLRAVALDLLAGRAQGLALRFELILGAPPGRPQT
jgi:hypothetical protein